MMRATSRLGMVLFCLLLWWGFMGDVSASQRTALVIGNGGYETAPLRNPVNDANDVARALRNLSFDVIEKTNVSRREMISAVDEFARRLQGAEVGLFYFAGHGMQIHGRNYLIPVGSHVSSESDVQFEAMDAGRVLGKMQEAGNKLNIVILDACRDNPFKRSFRTQNVGLAQMDAPKGTIIAYATSPGSVAADGEGKNGTYTKHLLKNLMVSGLSVQDILMETGIGVMRETGDKQIPWISSTPVSRYFLAGQGPIPNQVQTNPATEERTRLEQERLELERNKAATERRRIEEENARLERERRELEAVRAEIETKRQEVERKSREIASFPQDRSPGTPANDANVVERDGQYVAYSNGIVRDTKTGLEWVAGPDRDVNWYQAKSWAENVNLAGGGWRMPTFDDLKCLFKYGYGTRNMTPLLKTTGWWIWFDENRQALSFNTGKRDWGMRTTSKNTRVFAVRSSGGR